MPSIHTGTGGIDVPLVQFKANKCNLLICEYGTLYIVYVHTESLIVASSLLHFAERTIDERHLDDGDGECPGSTQQPNNTDQSPDHYQQSNAVLFPSGFIKPLLSLVKTKLSKHSLKSWPTDKHSLVWCLRQLTVSFRSLLPSSPSHPPPPSSSPSLSPTCTS